jgi:carboxyl-terminal processing protease
MKKLLFFLIIFLTISGSCKKGDIAPGGSNITPAQARDTLYNIMNQWYYWYDYMPSVTRSNYKDPYTLLEAMRYKELDRWSFVADYDEFTAEMMGTLIGHGFRIGLDDNSLARIAMIYKNSQLYSEGVRRGWIVKKINGVEIAPMLIAHDEVAYNNVIGTGTEEITNTFLFQKPDGTEVTIVSTKSSFTPNSVILYDTLDLSSGKTGHLVFESFIEPSEAELQTAFSFFKANNVKDLILDLRYNSGGYLTIAQQLASYIAGNGLTGYIFAQLQHNDKMVAKDFSYPFITTSYPLSLPKLIVITTRVTASASETVMNGLIPYINVIVIGDTTNGKPTGVNWFSCEKKYVFAPITIKVVNSLNQGDFFDGIYPDKTVSDDIAHDFTDRQEKCLKEAIHYLETGGFSAKGAEDFTRHVQFSEKPSWMNNAFVSEK